MPANLSSEPNDIYVLRVGGLLKHAEFAASQEALGKKIEQGSKPRLLAVVEDFKGFEQGADWNDLDFQIAYGDEIARIAIVAPSDLEVRALAFAGAGVRKAPVKFFRPAELEQARAWLMQ